jgi:hypothetical protein
MTENLALLDRPTTPDRLDYRSINAKAIKHWSTIYNMICDWHGRPLGEVQRLNPDFVELPHGRRRHGGPQLVLLRGPSPWDGGSWLCIGPPSAEGKDVVDLVAYLGECDRRMAAEWLGSLVDRVVEVA